MIYAPFLYHTLDCYTSRHQVLSVEIVLTAKSSSVNRAFGVPLCQKIDTENLQVGELA